MFFSSMILSMSAPSGGVFLQKEKAEYAQAHSTCDAVPTAADRDTARRPNGFESFLKAKCLALLLLTILQVCVPPGTGYKVTNL